jgi:hypothetical protein
LFSGTSGPSFEPINYANITARVAVYEETFNDPEELIRLARFDLRSARASIDEFRTFKRKLDFDRVPAEMRDRLREQVMKLEDRCAAVEAKIRLQVD